MPMRFVKLTEVAREAGIRPETARARARRAYEEPTSKRLPRPVAHWLFKESDVERVLKMIRKDH